MMSEANTFGDFGDAPTPSFSVDDAGAISYSVRIGKMKLLDGDNRAAKILQSKGIVQRRNWKIWSNLVWWLRPSWILDVGANHGEMSLPLVPVWPTSIDLFEPNRHLVECIRESLKESIFSDFFTLHDVAVSDSIGSTTFFIDKKWSGTSAVDFKAKDSPFKGKGAQEYEEVTVNTVTIDDLIRVRRASQNIGIVALKVDVEGHETSVFRAAQRLGECRFFSLVEYSDRQLQRAGTSLEELLSLLAGIGDIYEVDSGTGLMKIESVPDLSSSQGDLLVTNVPAIPKRLVL